MKKIASILAAVLSLSALTTTSFAATEGGYAGLGLGYSRQQTPDHNLITDEMASFFHQSRDIGGLGGRVFGGYNFNKNFGIEAGVAQYAQSKYKASLKPDFGMNANAKLTYDMTVLDLVGKAYLPVYDTGLNVYGLGGLALVHSKQKATFSADGFGSNSKSQTLNRVRPVLGAGASYDIPQTPLTTSLEYSYTFGQGNIKTDSKAIPAANLVTVNLAYNFG